MVVYGMAADFPGWRQRDSRPDSPAVTEVALAKIKIEPVGYFTSRRPAARLRDEPGGFVHAAARLREHTIERLRLWQLSL
jgi:hypothetical protein